MMTRHDLALASFWTERPLVRLYIATTGAAAFSLRQLIAFADQLPDAIFHEMSEAAVHSGRLESAAHGDRSLSHGERENLTTALARRPA